MNEELYFDEYVRTEKFRLSLNLGDCRLDPLPLAKGNGGVVYKARLNGFNVVLKFVLSDNENKKVDVAELCKKNYLAMSLMDYRKDIIQYLDYDSLRMGEVEIPILVMKPYKITLADCRSSLSPDTFVKLFNFLMTTVRYLMEHQLTQRAITPYTIFVDADNEFVLSDVAVPNPSLPADGYMRSIGEVLQWYTFGDTKTTDPVSSIFSGLSAYDQMVSSCLSTDKSLRFNSLDEIIANVKQYNEHNSQELMREFSLICRKNFPKELPGFVHCTDQRKISKLFVDLAAHNDFFGQSLVYFTDTERNIFSPQLGQSGYMKFDNSTEFRVLDVWIHCDTKMRNDYILVHHSNTLPEKVNNKEVYKWAVYNEQTRITWEEAMNGFAEEDGEIVPLDKNKIVFFNRIPFEGHCFIALSRFHSLSRPDNLSILRDYFFRFSFSYVNRYILDDMNHLISQHTENQAK